MTQSDLDVVDQAFPAFRSDMNSALKAVGNVQKGSSRPTGALAGWMWIDDSATPWILYVYDGTDDIKIGTINATTNLFLPANSVVQTANVIDSAVGSGTTVTPNDDSIPQSGEGDQYATLAIVPKNTNNILEIEVVYTVAHSAVTTVTMALFQDSTASALAAVQKEMASNDNANQLVLRHYMTAGTTSSTTFKIRIGGNTGATTTVNGKVASRRMGGVMASGITITEYAA